MIHARSRTSIVAGLLTMATVLDGCHRRAEDPSAVTMDEEAQLNDAAAMLDANGMASDASDANTSDGNTEDPT